MSYFSSDFDETFTILLVQFVSLHLITLANRLDFLFDKKNST